MKRYAVETVIDLGSSSLKGGTFIVGDDTALPQPQALTAVPSAGIKKGIVVNEGALAEQVTKLHKELEKQSGSQIKSVYIGLGSFGARCISSYGVAAAKGKAVTDQIKREAFANAMIMAIPNDMTLVSAVPNGFLLDSSTFLRQPIGHKCVRLEAFVFAVLLPSEQVTKAIESVELCGINVIDTLSAPLSAVFGTDILSSENSNSLVIDLGSSTTTIILIKNGSIVDLCSLKVGGDYITNRLARATEMSVTEAENAKIELDRSYNSSTAHPSVRSAIIQSLVDEWDHFCGLCNSEIFSHLRDKHIENLDKVILLGGGGESNFALSAFENILGVKCDKGSLVCGEDVQGVDNKQAIASVIGMANLISLNPQKKLSPVSFWSKASFSIKNLVLGS